MKITDIYKIKYKLYENIFDDLDAEGVDLSGLLQLKDPNLSYWNLHNTNLDFELTKQQCIIDCDLRGTRMNFSNIDYNVDSKSTNYDEIGKFIILYNVLLDKEQINKLNSIYEENRYFYRVDYNTIIKNPNLRVHGCDVISIIRNELGKKYYENYDLRFMSIDEINSQVKKIEDFLEICNSPEIKELYNNIKGQMKNYEKIHMFLGRVINGKIFHDITINEEMYLCLRYFDIEECNFKNVIFDIPTEMLSSSGGNYFDIENVEKIRFPNISLSDWNYDVEYNRIGETPFTFRRSLYIELGRTCNAKCSFCRNNCMKEEGYNLSNIEETFGRYGNAFDIKYIGGGEPTLRIKDLKKICSYGKFTIITNGTKGLGDLLSTHFGSHQDYMISRHSYDEKENAKIFGIPSNNFLSVDLFAYFKFKPTLACTCIKGGMDSVEKILDYIKFANYYHISSILFTNLQNDASVFLESVNKNNMTINIDDRVFDEAIEVLKANGMQQSKYPIISNSGYILTILKNPDYFNNYITINFKKYISKKELELLWVHAVKRSFDLSMSPSGVLYDNWSEKDVKTLVKK